MVAYHVASALAGSCCAVVILVRRVSRRPLATVAFIGAGVLPVAAVWPIVVVWSAPAGQYTRLTLKCGSTPAWINACMFGGSFLVVLSVTVGVAGIVRLVRLRDLAGFAVILFGVAMLVFALAVVFLGAAASLQTECD